MTAQPVEAPVLDYTTLDDLGEQVAAVALALWVLREELGEAGWLDTVVDVLVSALLQAEASGRLFGSAARPVDGIAITPSDDTPRRPAPEDFAQRSEIAPAPSREIQYVARGSALRDRLSKAVTTIVETGGVDEIERLARDETIAAAQRGYQDGVRLQDNAPQGYRRGINPDCCELCFWLWKEGFVYDIDQPMHRHVGCRCVPVPTTDPRGKWALNDEEQALLDSLYEKYQAPRNRNRGTGEPND